MFFVAHFKNEIRFYLSPSNLPEKLEKLTLFFDKNDKFLWILIQKFKKSGKNFKKTRKSDKFLWILIQKFKKSGKNFKKTRRSDKFLWILIQKLKKLTLFSWPKWQFFMNFDPKAQKKVGKTLKKQEKSSNLSG